MKIVKTVIVIVALCMTISSAAFSQSDDSEVQSATPSEVQVPVLDKVCWNDKKVALLADCPARPEITTINMTCWDGSAVLDVTDCPPVIRDEYCPDGITLAMEGVTCPEINIFTCPDGSSVSDLAICKGIIKCSICDQKYLQEVIYYQLKNTQSDQTKATITRLMAIGRDCEILSVEVIAHTDTSGRESENLRISQERAALVRDELIFQGVNADMITEIGRGETEPFIKSGNDKVERLNSRAEVIIHVKSTRK